MARLDEFIFGYSEGKVNKDDLTKLLSTLLRTGICSSIGPNGDFTVREKDRGRFVKNARSKMRFELSEPRGLYGFFVRNKQRYGVFASLLILLGVFLFTRSLIWDVRISGNVSLSEETVAETLRESGFEIGSSWRSMDKNLLEASLLSTHPEIAWISVNRRGTVAYVELIESENIGKIEESHPRYSNVVADRDGVIEEITVNSGEATVKVGDVVKKGDVLISGITENEAGVRFCRAEGTVRAHSVTELSAEATRQISENVVARRRIGEIKILIFNFSINIFKNYGNCENNCDIIEETRDFALFDRYRLPVSLKKSYVVEYSTVTRTRTDDEMISTAKAQLDETVRSEFKDADIIKLRTEGGFSGDAYRLTTRVVYAVDIGKESAIEIN